VPQTDTDAATAREPDQARATGRRALAELLLTAELAGLAAFTFTRPVLDSFGRSPEVFTAQQATRGDIVWFGLLVTLVPALLAATVGWLARTAARDRCTVAQAALVGLLAGVGAWRMGQDQASLPGTAVQLVLLGLAVGLLVGFEEHLTQIPGGGRQVGQLARAGPWLTRGHGPRVHLRVLSRRGRGWVPSVSGPPTPPRCPPGSVAACGSA
jgi:uncharacterized membrane protein